MHSSPWPYYPWLGPSRGEGEAGGGSHSSGWDTSGDQGRDNSQQGKRETPARCCPSGAPSGAACCCPDAMWSSICASVAIPAMGHMLSSSSSPPCCSQGDSPAALGPWAPWGQHNQGQGRSWGRGNFSWCSHFVWVGTAKDSHDPCALSQSRADQELPRLWLLSTSILGS